MNQRPKQKKNKKRKTKPVLFAGNHSKVKKVEVPEIQEGPVVTFTALKRKIGSEAKVKDISGFSGPYGPKVTGLEIIEKETNNTQSKSKEVLNWLLWPLPADQFYEQQFERFCCSLNRQLPNFYEDWVTMKDLSDIFSHGALVHGESLFINSETPYEDGEEVDEAMFQKLVDSSNCKIRVNGVHRMSSRIATLITYLEEFFSCPYDASIDVYSKSTEASPYQDSADCFVLQFEGETKWEFYGMEFQDENLSRHEAHEVAEEEAGTSMMSVSLKQGDILYIPRGTIFKSQSLDSVAGILILTFAQFNGWVDFMESVVTKALTKAVMNDVAFRKSLPRDYHEHLGQLHAKNESLSRKDLIEKVKTLCNTLVETYIPNCIDVAGDDLMCQFLKYRKAPQLLLSSKETQEEPQDETMENEEENGEDGPALTEKMKIRLLSKSVLRFTEDDDCYLHYSQTYEEGDDPSLSSYNCVNVPPTYRDGIFALYKAYPKYTTIKDLPFETPEEKIEFSLFLAEKEVLMVE